MHILLFPARGRCKTPVFASSNAVQASGAPCRTGRSRFGTRNPWEKFQDRGRALMANVIWTLIVILFVLWLIGLIVHIGGALIHLLLVVAVVALIVNLLTRRRAG